MVVYLTIVESKKYHVFHLKFCRKVRSKVIELNTILMTAVQLIITYEFLINFDAGTSQVNKFTVITSMNKKILFVLISISQYLPKYKTRRIYRAACYVFFVLSFHIFRYFHTLVTCHNVIDLNTRKIKKNQYS